ncbi:M20 family metallopeptidase [Oscillospiraceae bacterium LTW-04]|nr:M20 family metallopeptidase [Oscillospiraceae bacterium MB24-C1]
MKASFQDALDVIDRQAGALCAVSDAIWETPETAFLEYASAKVLIDALKEFGFSVTEKVGGIDTAFSARYGSGKPVIGILGEFDALSGLSQEADSAEKKAISPGEPGHGCGHNLLGAGSLAAAVAIREYLKENNCSGTVVYFGCPGEEGGSGKAFMARDGVFDELDCALTWHPWDINAVSNETSLANYQVAYRFKGVSSHAAATPHLGRSALDAVELMNVGVQFLREHMIEKARIHYAITNSGGFSPNVVPPEAEVLYLIRAPKNQQLEALFGRVNKIAQGAALMTETTMEYDFIKACSNMVVNWALLEVFQQSFEEIAPPDYTDEEIAFAKQIIKSFENSANPYEYQMERYSKEDQAFLRSQMDKPIYDFIAPLTVTEGFMGGSTDVGDVSWVCPTAQIFVTAKAALTPAHSWQQVAQGKSTIAHKGMLYAGKVIAATAIKLIEQPSLVEEAKAEHQKRLGGQRYRCAIPKDVRPRSIAPKK